MQKIGQCIRLNDTFFKSDNVICTGILKTNEDKVSYLTSSIHEIYIFYQLSKKRFF